MCFRACSRADPRATHGRGAPARCRDSRPIRVPGLPSVPGLPPVSVLSSGRRRDAVSKMARSATVSVLAAALLVVTATPSHAWGGGWGGGRVVIGVGHYGGAPCPHRSPSWGPTQ